jgi:hypothetical protein
VTIYRESRWSQFIEVIRKSDPEYDPNMGCGLYCPSGHKFKDDFILNETGLRCRHKNRQGHEDCSRMILVVAGGLTSVRGKPMYAVIEVSPDEMKEMALRRMKYHEMIEYLGMGYRQAA